MNNDSIDQLKHFASSGNLIRIAFSNGKLAQLPVKKLLDRRDSRSFCGKETEPSTGNRRGANRGYW